MIVNVIFNIHLETRQATCVYKRINRLFNVLVCALSWNLRLRRPQSRCSSFWSDLGNRRRQNRNKLLCFTSRLSTLSNCWHPVWWVWTCSSFQFNYRGLLYNRCLVFARNHWGKGRPFFLTIVFIGSKAVLRNILLFLFWHLSLLKLLLGYLSC